MNLRRGRSKPICSHCELIRAEITFRRRRARVLTCAHTRRRKGRCGVVGPQRMPLKNTCLALGPSPPPPAPAVVQLILSYMPGISDMRPDVLAIVIHGRPFLHAADNDTRSRIAIVINFEKAAENIN